MRSPDGAADHAAAPRQLSPDLTLGQSGRVWEGIVTTTSADGSTNIAPMGPIAGAQFDRLLLRPFESSRTHANLLTFAAGVFHLVDDVELLARAAIGCWDEPPELTPIAGFGVERLVRCGRWYAFEVEWLDRACPRATALARVVQRGVADDLSGFNRAKAAVVEAAILATRVDLLEPEAIRRDLAPLGLIVEKTGAAQERRAFALLSRYVDAKLGAAKGGRAR